MRIISSVLTCVLLICPAVAKAAEGDFYVDGINGSNRSPGTEAAPFRSLEQARDAIRFVRSSGLPEGGVTVWIRGGTYERTSTFTLSNEDSGQAGKPITYRAYPGEEVRIVGGRQLQPDWFAPVTADSPVWGRLDEAAKGNLVEVDLAAHGIADFGILRNRGFGKGGDAAMELFFGDEAMQLGKWPNEGFENVATVPDARNGYAFTYSGTRPERWLLAEEPLFFGYWYHGWAELYSTGTIDANTSTVMLDYDPQYGIKVGAYWYALNLLEEIDMPGEWYLNRSSGILYFWSPKPLESERIAVSTLAEPLVELQDVSHVRFDRIIFELGWTTLVRVDGGEHNLISNCIVRNGGTDGIDVSGENNRVICCEIYGQGNKGIALSGGDRYALNPCGNGVHNCHIHHFARWCRTYRPAVGISAVGAVVSHNLMHDGPHSAILTGRNENLIEYNRIYNACTETDDSGAIYTGR
ncbi:MAG: right-handed parallel beta-helix repeat-containing protein, partial [Planctomycetota bacterium]